MGSNIGAQRRGYNERGSKTSYAVVSSLHKYTPFKGVKTGHMWPWSDSLFMICKITMFR
jgi:hypothetical protein